jgi:hypothetical protein
MTVHEFNSLPEKEQIDLLLHSGNAVGRRVKGIYNYELYQFLSFYVEIKYPWSYYVSKGIKAFEPESEEMELYIGNIKLPKFNAE